MIIHYFNFQMSETLMFLEEIIYLLVTCLKHIKAFLSAVVVNNKSLPNINKEI